MNILGISAFGQNPAACLLVNGKLIAFAEEERFIRIKTAFGKFPTEAIKYCLQEGGISLSDIHEISIGWDYAKYSTFMPIFSAKLWLEHAFLKHYSSSNRGLIDMITLQPKEVSKQISFHLSQLGLSGTFPTVSYVSHHKAHAASSYYASGFSDSLIAVIDGSGEERATTLYKARGLDISEITHQNIPHSLGWLYAAFTAYLGFKPYEDDGFVMGLSSYGKFTDEYTQKVSRIVQIRRDMYEVDPTYTLLGSHTYSEHFSDKLVELFGPFRRSFEPITQRHKNIAYAVQTKLEDVVLQSIRTALPSAQSNNICLAGGVALNCKMNGKIAASGIVSNLFIQPSSNDSGTALGAAMLCAAAHGEDPRFRMSHAKWGPSFSEKIVAKTLDEAMISYSRPKNIGKTIAQAIAQGKIVARFDGRMEMGPRALGGRSILADASKKGMDTIINKRIKHREPWRPFCPSMISEVASVYSSNCMENRFMTVVYDVPKASAPDIPSVVHIDRTSRPQAVHKSVDPDYYGIIKSVGEHTGVPVVLNTSLNVKGEPIACKPIDALRCFESTGIDALALQGFWIEK